MISDEEFLRIVSFVKSKYGIDLHGKKAIINGRLENYLRRGGWGSFSAFMNDVERDRSGDLEKTLMNYLTTNHTYFMREFGHFDFFKKEVLPWAQKKAMNTKDLRIWCGASSSGEEPYMIAMTLRDFLGLDHEKWDARILATDISTQALSQPIRGVYDEEHMEKIPENWKKHFFHKTPNGQYAVDNEIKQQVIFRKFNLMDPFPFKKKMHTVFLRNVMIYFDEETKRQLVQKVYDTLEPGGYLFVGMTETIDRDSTPFQIIQPSIFRKM